MSNYIDVDRQILDAPNRLCVMINVDDVVLV